MTTRRSDVLVIGAGVIGLAITDELARRGEHVILLDRGEPGFGCSYGNAGWITPSQSLPLPRPGMLPQATRWLLDPESPLYIKPRPSRRLASWLLGFLRSMSRARFERSVAALVPFTLDALDRLAELEAESGHSIGLQRQGLLSVAESDAGLESALHLLELVSSHGVVGRRVDAAEVRELEPAIVGDVVGGVFFPDEAHVEPLDVVRAYAARARRNGATILPQHEVTSFRSDGGRLTAVATYKGPFEAGRFVLATGSWSADLGARLGINLPILGGKGYAVIVPPPDPMPRRSILVLERKVAITPRSGSLRIAGTLELVDGDESITARRVHAIVKGARRMLAIPGNPRILETWRGLRPCTPDGMPIIGFAPRYENLLIATGHQMLGLKAAPGTARLAADLLLGQPPGFDPAPYRADRF